MESLRRHCDELEPEIMPETLGLIREIERLERLAAIPAASQAFAG